MRAVLEVQHVTKKYGKVTAVDDVSFNVAEGEIVGLLGPNGAGKSTTIQILLSLINPTEGVIKVFGKSLREHREEVLNQMNFAAPYAALPYNLTPIESLRVFALFYGLKDWREKAEKLLKEFQLEKFRNARTGGLSSGEQTRLAMAKAFINEPKLLLLDEPTSSLDPAIARKLREEVYNRTKKVGGSVLWTSHNMREVEAMCDRVIFLSHGKVVAADTPKNLHKQFGKEDLEEIFIELAKQHDG